MARINGATIRKGGRYDKYPLNFLIGEDEEIKLSGIDLYNDGKASLMFSTIRGEKYIQFGITFDKDEWNELSKDIYHSKKQRRNNKLKEE